MLLLGGKKGSQINDLSFHLKKQEVQIKLKASKRKEKRRAEINEFENRKKTPIKQKASLKRSIKLTNFQPDWLRKKKRRLQIIQS